MPSTPMKNRLSSLKPPSTPSPSKNHLSVKQKAEICEDSSKPGFDKDKVCEKFAISKATLNRILQRKSEFLKIADQQPKSHSSKQKSLRKPKNFELEMKLCDWIRIRQEKGYPVSGDDIRARGLHLAKNLKIDDFTPSNGWIDRFKKRFDIRFKTFQGEKASADLEAANEFLEQDLPPLLEQYGEKNTYNCDETGKFGNVFSHF